MKNLLMALIMFGLTIQAFAQTEREKLSEIEILGVNYKYLDALGTSEVATPVKILEKKIAAFDLKMLLFMKMKNRITMCISPFLKERF